MTRSRERLLLAVLLVTSVVSFSVARLYATETGKPASRDPAGPLRARAGLLALYTFDGGSGPTIRDRSHVGQPLDLEIRDASAVEWKAGHLLVRSATTIASSGPATKITEAIQRSGAATIEAWIEPADATQEGPARIVSLSADTGQRNFTLGQAGDRYDVRFRTTATDHNGNPSTAANEGAARTELTHVIYTRDAAGSARFYVDGTEQSSAQVAGALSNWDGGFTLVLANETTGDRPWLGTFHLVALYGRDLTAQEIKQNFEAGPAAASAEDLARHQEMELFETKIAPLLAQNCLRCHDSAAREGGLDLSRRAEALAGGDSGELLVPGNAAESFLLDRVELDEMPPEGPFLSADEKKLLRKWIDSGATWSLDWIDPAVYVRGTSAGQLLVKRLTVPEYVETVRAAVGVDISAEAREMLPPDLRADGFRNTVYNLNVDLEHVEAYARLAELIVERMDVSGFTRRFSESQSLSTDTTMRDFVAALGKHLFRGPLNDREITNYSGIATSVASAGGDFEEAVRCIVEAMLQSPRFIYLVENQHGDGTGWPASGYEVASRMSYIIWGGPPDEELMAAAESGELQDRRHVASQVQRMLQDSRAVARSCQFISQWLHLDRLDNLQPNSEKFPDWEPELAHDMREETLAFFRHLAWEENRPLSDLFNAQFTYATPRLAEHYALEPKGSGLEYYDLSSVPARGGLLTQGSVLTVGGDEASMVTRGLFVLHDLLRGVVNDPPPGVDTTPVPAKPGLSNRAISEERIANVSCSGCHLRFEPLAFGLETFDGLGAFRLRDEHGNKLREDGEVLFPGEAGPVEFESSAELMDLLAGSERVRQTITWKLAQFALGRPLGAADARIMQRMHEAAWDGGGTYGSLITAIVTSDLVMMKKTQGSTPAP